MDQATTDSRAKIKAIYSEIAKASEEQENLWKSNQEELIKQSFNSSGKENNNEINFDIELLTNLNNNLNQFFIKQEELGE